MLNSYLRLLLSGMNSWKLSGDLHLRNTLKVTKIFIYYDLAKDVDSEAAALEKLMLKHIIPNCSQFNCQSFREKRYWNEECDNILKSHFALFESLYVSNSGSRKLPGEKT